MTEMEKISTGLQLIKGRLYEQNIQIKDLEKKIMDTRRSRFDIGRFVERGYALKRERARMEILLELFENGVFEEDRMDLFTGRNELNLI